ncbi:MAG: porin family protein [Bacteroidota bacterium]
MKKSILLLLAIASMASFSNAQNTDSDFREKLQIGAKVGLNYANVYDTQGEKFNADGKFGFAGGVFLAIPIGKYLGVQPEVLYSQKGFQATGSILGFDYKYTHTASYLDIPIFVALKPSEFITILAGPQYSYLLSYKNEFTNTIYSYDQEQEFNNENIRKNTFCFIGGIDINIKNIVIGARAGWDLSKNNGDGTSTTPRYKNTWYQGTIGFKF